MSVPSVGQTVPPAGIEKVPVALPAAPAMRPAPTQPVRPGQVMPRSTVPEIGQPPTNLLPAKE
ncbi:hypothetical protein [Defluviicoccus vanus]|uniref:Uncharacterized protein n=1 Tax=Defluviicoccus vanus TaxID=111831 RepID=A0A7H1MYB9_9PROT|nr:hypothetical protein [Defluviicoccus vanus]QNT68455.1 hypothetical protein HQ394_02615 [Defluviicoccus vanus]